VLLVIERYVVFPMRHPGLVINSTVWEGIQVVTEAVIGPQKVKVAADKVESKI
jgi:hypothetical protein